MRWLLRHARTLPRLHGLAGLIGLASAGLIVRVGVQAWERPCRAGIALPPGLPCPSLAEDMVPLLVAFGVAAIALVIWVAGRQTLAPIFFLLVADALAAGVLTNIDTASGDAGRLFYLLLAWLAPVTFHFHYTLLRRLPRRLGRVLLAMFCLVALLISIPLVLWTLPALEETGLFSVLRMTARLALIAALGLGQLLLVRDYRKGASPAARRSIRLIAFGTLFAFAPMILLSLLPETLGARIYVPYELTFPWLLLSPLAYAYSTFRDRLLRAEAGLNCAGVYYLLVTLIFGVYVLAAALLGRLAADATAWWPLASAALGAAFLLAFARLDRALRRLMTWILYGGEVTYASVVGHLAESLSVTLDRDALCRLLLQDLAAAMRLSRSMLFLRDSDGALALAGCIGFPPESAPDPPLQADGALALSVTALNKPETGSGLRKTLRVAALSAGERRLLFQDEIALWMPLVSADTLQGLLLVGAKTDGDPFTDDDRRILATLCHQSGIAAHNVRLMEEVKAGRRELARAHQQLLAGREREQRRLAHALHDDAVQHLLGISYQVFESARRAAAAQPDEPDAQVARLESIRAQLLVVVRQLRGLIGDLRPAGLQELGLVPALEGYVSRLVREGGSDLPEIELDLRDRPGIVLSESVAICLFRCAQEALRNALKHAEASVIRLSLCMQDGQAELVVQDDGRGFRVPARLTELASADHFGIVGMAERVGWVGGELKVQSRPGAGATVSIRVPLDQRDTEDEKDDSGTVGG